MGVSAIQEQHDIIIGTIRNITKRDWKVLVIDEGSKKIIDNVVKEDDILNQNIANIERIEERREDNQTMDAIYMLSPQPHIVDCLMADFERGRYRKSYLVWIALLDPQLRRRIDNSQAAQQQLAGFETLSVDYFPRESHLITFRDPWSFPILYHPACNNLVREHMTILAQKITGICVSLGEYPKVRYYRPRNPIHEASVLCSHLARFVQEELDEYAQWNPNFPPATSRPQGVLVITDRSMDLMAPLIHEFTYQAMAHDLLPIKDGEKVSFHMVINEGTSRAEEKDMEILETDKVWVDSRHMHMKDTIDKLMNDFQKFIDQNPNFTDEGADKTSLNAIKDMLAGLPQFQQMKEAYSLHLTMAQDAMNVFQQNKLPDIASIEQTLSTGLDENLKKPKNVLDQVARLLDDDAITPSDRLRLIMMYIMYRDGVILEDIKRLLAHSSLPPQDGEIITNLELLGARTTHGLKDTRPYPTAVFPKNPKTMTVSEDYALSRFEPAVKTMLDELCKGTLDQTLFPYTKPPLDPNEDALANQGSLRAAKPSWAGAGRRVPENKQRIIVFMAGGATYSESRSCYEVGNRQNRDVLLATSHMVTPAFFVRQVGDLSVDKRRLDIPMERPKPRAPAHLFEQPTAAPMQPMAGSGSSIGMSSGGGKDPRGRPGPAPPSGGLPARRPGLPAGGGLPGRPGRGPSGQSTQSTQSSSSTLQTTQAMSQMSLNSNGDGQYSGGAGTPSSDNPPPAKHHNKLEKDPNRKKRGFFGIKS